LPSGTPSSATSPASACSAAATGLRVGALTGAAAGAATDVSGRTLDHEGGSGSADDSYPVRMHFAGPLERYSRLKTFFRLILAIPIVILRYVLNLLLEIGAVAAWFVVVVTGKMPRGLFDLMVLVNSYIARSDAYLFLLTETYPPFQDDETRAAGVATA